MRPQEDAEESPEALFYALPMSRRHEALWSPQAEILKQYVALVDEPNISVQLPTGQGKSAAALLIAEWDRRRHRRPVAYVTLTNQLAGQVLDEAAELAIDAADLRGNQASRSAAEEGRFRSANAIGVSTYSNLFNVNPVIKDADLLILDDAHGGEKYAADMWTIRVSREKDGGEYLALLGAVAPSMTGRSLRSIKFDKSDVPVLAPIHGNQDVVDTLSQVCSDSDAPSVKFPFMLLRGNLEKCVCMVSRHEIVIRPYVIPTFSHIPFASARQRIFLSATTSQTGDDLMRAYALPSIRSIFADYVDEGRRFIFLPGLYVSDPEAHVIASRVMERAHPRRTCLIAPSDVGLSSSLKELLEPMIGKHPSIVTSDDIADSLQPFTDAEHAVLTLAGRYDGVDLKDDACHLLVMAGAPKAVGELERHLTERWAQGPILASKLRNRIIQGLGRCTRGSRDYAVVIWLRQSLVDTAMNQALQSHLPEAIQAELRWGIAQSELAGENGEGLAELIIDMLADPALRTQADEGIRDERRLLAEERREAGEPLSETNPTVAREIAYGRAIWQGDFERAFEAAHRVADDCHGDALAGVRAWWWYLASMAALLMRRVDQAADTLQRARLTGVYPAFLSEEVQRIAAMRGVEEAEASLDNAESCWEFIDSLGWQGKAFGRWCDEARARIDDSSAAAFESGLRDLGLFLGLEAERPTGQGVPDGVWALPNGEFLAWEAKSEKQPDSELSQRELQQSNGHIDWCAEHYEVDRRLIVPVIVSPSARVDIAAATPHMGDLRYLSPDELRSLMGTAIEVLAEFRARCSGQPQSAAVNELRRDLSARGLLFPDLGDRLRRQRLADLNRQDF